MKRLIAIGAASLVIALAVFGCGHNPADQQWITLINGDSGLENFNRLGGANWRAEGGAIVADKSTVTGTSKLVSKKSFKDFELVAEVWADHDTNSGIYLRCTNTADVSTASAYEVQIWDRNPDPTRSTGALMPASTVTPIFKAGGRWNTFEIYAKGAQMTVKLNGVVTAHVENGRFPSGPIALQYGAGLIKWRKVVIREL